jgi:hypothetical protein
MKYDVTKTPTAKVYIQESGFTVEVFERGTHKFIEAMCCDTYEEKERYLEQLNDRYGGVKNI